jgi:hypothetical protein
MLEQIEVLIPYAYAQVLAEHAPTRDYRVIAERIPAGAAGYAVAHRTGVIGQVFRTQRAIIVTDTHHHPLYDPFDVTVDWEVALPLIRSGALAGVLNVEGNGVLTLQPDTWNRVSRIVTDETAVTIPQSPPDAYATVLVRTERSFFDQEFAMLDSARRLAGEGKSVLMLTTLPEFARSAHPTLTDARQGRISLAECINGFDDRIDAIILDGHGLSAFESLGGWSLVDGRYDVVLARN